jgi:hypothetical protein
MKIRALIALHDLLFVLGIVVGIPAFVLMFLASRVAKMITIRRPL